jgi:hypothetical protein
VAAEVYAEVGTVDGAVEGFYDDDDKLKFQPLYGERTTRFVFPPDTSAPVAAREAISALTHHIREERHGGGKSLVWIESNDAALRNLLCEHFGVDKRKRKPASWGGEIGTKKKKAPAPEPETEPEETEA